MMKKSVFNSEEEKLACLIRILEECKKHDLPVDKVMDVMYENAPDEYINGIPYDVTTVKIENI